MFNLTVFIFDVNIIIFVKNIRAKLMVAKKLRVYD
jgi:hypothetical protein